MSVYLPSFISFNVLVNMLHPLALFTCYTCLCFVVEVVNKLRHQYEGTLKYLRENVTGMKFRLRKGWKGSDTSIVTRRFKCIDAGQMCRWIIDVSCANVQWFSHWKIKAVDCDIMKWHHNYLSCYAIKGEHTQTSGLSSGFSDTEWLGLLTSHRPSTLAILVPLVEQRITRMNCVFHLSICMYPDLLGNFLVSITLVVWC